MLNSFSDIRRLTKATAVKQKKNSLEFKWKYNKKIYHVFITTTDYAHVSISHKNPNIQPELSATKTLVNICFDGSKPIDLHTKGFGIRPNVFHFFERELQEPLSFTLRNKNYEKE